MAKFSAQFLNTLANPTYAKGLLEAGKGLGQTPGILMEQKRRDEEREKIAGMTRLEAAEYLVGKANTAQERLIAQSNLETVKRQEKADAEEKAKKEGAASIEIMRNQIIPLANIVNAGGVLDGAQRGMLSQLGEGINKVSRITGAPSTFSPLQQSALIGQSGRQEKARDIAETQRFTSQRLQELGMEATSIANKPELSTQDEDRLNQIEQQRFRLANGMGMSTANIIGSTEALLTDRRNKIDDNIERAATATALRETRIVDLVSASALDSLKNPKMRVSSMQDAVEMAIAKFNLTENDKINLQTKIMRRVKDEYELFQDFAESSREGYLSDTHLEFITKDSPARSYIIDNNPDAKDAFDRYTKQLAFENGEEGAVSPYSIAPANSRRRDAVLISKLITEDAKRVQKLNSSDEALRIKFSTAVNEIINTPEMYNLSSFRKDDLYEIVEDLKSDDNQAQYNDLQDRVVLALKNNPSQKIIPAIKTALSDMGINTPGQQQSEAEIRRQKELKQKLDITKAELMEDGLTEPQAAAQIREIQTQERIGQMLVALGDPTRQRFSEFTSEDLAPLGETREEMEARAATGINNSFVNLFDLRERRKREQEGMMTRPELLLPLGANNPFLFDDVREDYRQEQEATGTPEDADRLFNTNWQGM